MNISQLSRRNFLQSLMVMGAASLFPIKLNATPPCFNDIYTELGKERGIARRSLMEDVLQKGTYSQYVTEKDQKVWIGYSHEDNYQLFTDYGQKRDLTWMGYSVFIPTGHYTIIAKSQKEADEKLADKEDKVFFKLVKQAAPELVVSKYLFEKNVAASLSAAFSRIEKYDLIVSTVVMHPTLYRKCFGQKDNIDWVDETHYIYMPRGDDRWVKNLVGYLLGASLLLSDLMPENEILLSAPAEYVGAMPIRVPLYELGKFDIYIQEAGQVVINDYALLKVKIV